jgi:hypothetical protein
LGIVFVSSRKVEEIITLASGADGIGCWRENHQFGIDYSVKNNHNSTEVLGFSPTVSSLKGSLTRRKPKAKRQTIVVGLL